MEFVIDRFEGDLAVIEGDGDKFYNLPREILPPNVREGDVIIIERGNDKSRKARIDKLMDNLFE